MKPRISTAACSDDSLVEEIGRFRYDIYVDQLGYPQSHADHARRVIVDPLDATAVNFYARAEGGEIVGVCRQNFCRDGMPDSYVALHRLQAPEHPQHTALTTRLMVREDYRLTRLPFALMRACYEACVQASIKYCHVDCYAPLVETFERLGFEFQFRGRHGDYGDVHCMRLDVDNGERLRSVRSPFYPVWRRLRGVG
ncbi:MAG: GNAT family N-acetyltransferase [Pseudomonadota bacterium]